MFIPNGVDLERFRVGNAERAVTRGQLGIADDELVVISVGRVHAIKGHNILIRSMSAVIDAVPATRFVVVGRGSDWSQAPFSRYQVEKVVRRHAILLGERSDIVDLLFAADVFVSPSETEGFPNAVAEAMAACLPSVVTDVGDCALLVDDCGVVVSPGDPDSLAAGLLQVLSLSESARATMGKRAATRIETEFSLPGIAKQYAAHYREILARKSAGT
jgi:glycosyltransferase involved in cell wall biosynthesis